MSQAKKVIVRMVTALAIVFAGAFAVASPAQAHPEVDAPICYAEYQHADCSVNITGAVAPMTIRWYYRTPFTSEVYLGGCDDSIYCGKSCQGRQWFTIKVVVTDASANPVTQDMSWYCWKFGIGEPER